ncbi:MAG TPA: hypothetical protein VFY83_17155, partial [Anaerolineales bacterium]|nr:hypothetical protein [Anaerolineales bacterium]
MITLESLGLTKEELANRVVQKIADDLLTEIVRDEYGETYPRASQFAETLKNAAQDCLNKKIEEIADAHLLPLAGDMIENVVLQETNKWGEKVGKPLTFKEYLVQRAENYMTEMVDWHGKNKKEGGYGWSGTQTRIAHMIHEHFHYSIKACVMDMLKNANSVLNDGIVETVKIKLN